jgi:hypothetical protein
VQLEPGHPAGLTVELAEQLGSWETLGMVAPGLPLWLGSSQPSRNLSLGVGAGSSVEWIPISTAFLGGRGL